MRDRDKSERGGGLRGECVGYKGKGARRHGQAWHREKAARFERA